MKAPSLNTGHGWIERSCSYVDQNPTYAMCVFSCGSGPTTAPTDASTDAPTDTPTTNIPTTSSAKEPTRLMYNVYKGDKIYDYRIDFTRSSAPEKLGEYDIPFFAYQPNLAYNYQRSVLEVVGDHWLINNNNHYFMDSNGQFSKGSVISEFNIIIVN